MRQFAVQRQRLGSALRVTLGLILLGGEACDSFTGRRLEVEFRTVDGLRAGDAVYRAGIRIGSTGAAFLRQGRAIVPVFVRRDGDLPRGGVIFLLAEDSQRPGRRCLRIYSLGVGDAPQAEGVVFRGASNELELIAGLGYARAMQVLGLLTEQGR